MRTLYTTFIRLSVVVVLLLGTSAGADEARVWAFSEKTLPPGWTIAGGVRVPAAQLPGFSQRLGGKIVSLTNQNLRIGGLAVKANLMVGASGKDAEKLERRMHIIRGRDFVARDGRLVFEISGNNVLVARRVLAALGIGADAEVTWSVSFRIALVDELDQTAGNRVFNHFLALQRDPDDGKAKQAIAAETKGWKTGRTLRLLRSSPGALDVEWSFDPEPSKSEEGPLTTTYSFGDVPTAEGLPYVDVKGRLEVPARYGIRERHLGGPLALTAATPFWPVDAERVKTEVADARQVPDQQGRTSLLLRRVGETVSYGGATGTRDGVLEVLGRGHGRCWDKSDVFVTFCRAAGIPARQVGGWVPVIGAGHIWTEVYVDGGWLPVDPTTTWLGTSADYIPFFATEAGSMPIVYLRMPEIRRAD